MSHSVRRRCTAAIGALALGVGLAGLGAVPAYAVTVANTSDINDAIAASELEIELSANITLDEAIDTISHGTAATPVVINGNGHTVDLNGFGWSAVESSVEIRNLTLVDTSASPVAEALHLDLPSGHEALIDTVTTDGVDLGLLVEIAVDAEVLVADSTFRNGVDGVRTSVGGIDGTLRLHDVTVDTMSMFGMYLTGGAAVEVLRGEILNTGFLAFIAASVPLTMDGTVMQGGADGMVVDYGGAAFATIQNVTVSGFSGFGMEIGSVGATVNVFRSELFDNGSVGLRVHSGGAGSVSVRESTIRDNGGVGGIAGVEFSVSDSAHGLIQRSTVSGNENVGIQLTLDDDADATIQNTTVSGNAAGSSTPGTGGIVVERRMLSESPPTWGTVGAAHALIEHTTVTNNTGYAGISFFDIPGTLSHTVSAANNATSGDLVVLDGPDDLGVVTTEWSVFGPAVAEPGAPAIVQGTGVVTGVLDPGLGPLADNGGVTLTHLPAASSVLIDTGVATVSDPPLDQRRLPRVSGDAVDIGSVEVQQALAATGLNPSVAVLGGLMLLALGGVLLLARFRGAFIPARSE